MGQRSNARRLRRANRTKRVVDFLGKRLKKNNLSHVEVTGFNAEGKEVDMIVCRIQDSEGNWITPRSAKEAMRKDGAISFKRINRWKEAA